MQVVLDIREKELEARQMEMAKIIAALNDQKAKLQTIILAQQENKTRLEEISNTEELDITQAQMHQNYAVTLSTQGINQERIIANTESILKRKQQEVREAHQKVEVLKKLKEKQEQEYYKEFLQTEAKEIDDITSARFRFNDSSIN